MALWKRRSKQVQADLDELVPDEATAVGRAERAQILVDVAAELACAVDFSREGIAKLDLVVTRLTQKADGSKESLLSIGLIVDAYLGEVIRHTCGGRWVTTRRADKSAVELPSGVPIMSSLVVAQRLTGVPGGQLLKYFDEVVAAAQAPGPTPSDEPVAHDMAELAAAFVRGSAEEGRVFGYDLESAYRLEAAVDDFLATRPSADYLHSMIMSMGAYLGELLVRHRGGRWVAEAGSQEPGVDVGAGVVAHPLNKVAKRITIGPEHSITQFFDAAADPAALR